MSIKPSIKTTKTPEDMILCSNSRGSFWPPRAASTSSKARVPPSSAGNGSRLITAKFKLITAAN
ncbi:hypothetical protein IEQ34_026692 [Dendrobium chrysotoxum]|uniref:Uncharacterized protein n=1 Tax=Dendrobium chrysotoxum TaxID=161865 RepID=A0AAV7FL53_DENCH|nr:hypothetical protein IEQ34_026692 [Dendrobium chrysotoxum]